MTTQLTNPFHGNLGIHKNSGNTRDHGVFGNFVESGLQLKGSTESRGLNLDDLLTLRAAQDSDAGVSSIPSLYCVTLSTSSLP